MQRITLARILTFARAHTRYHGAFNQGVPSESSRTPVESRENYAHNLRSFNSLRYRNVHTVLLHDKRKASLRLVTFTDVEYLSVNEEGLERRKNWMSYGNLKFGCIRYEC